MVMTQQENRDESVGKRNGGLSAAELTLGRLVTVSVNKTTGDRSLCQVIWEIISTNDAHALMTCRHLCHLLHDVPPTRLVALHEHDFYAADALVAAMGAEENTLN
jgi:hypothetical protein